MRRSYQVLRNRLARIATLGDMSITSRLVLAFGSVAVLAAAANLIVENGATIVQSFRAPEVAIESATTADETVREQGRLEAQRVQARELASRVALALGNFDKLVRARADGVLPDTSAPLEHGLRELTLAAEAFIAAHRATPHFPEAVVRAGIDAHGRTALALVEAARERRTAVDRYASTLASMNARLQKSIDGAWKIMGRVIARQSLLKLSADLDAVEASFAGRGPAASATVGLARVQAAEQVFAATFEKSAAALARSQGEEWRAGMTRDLEKLSSWRRQLAKAETSQTSLAKVFGAESEALLRDLSHVPMPERVERPVVADAAIDSSAPAPAALALPAPVAPAAVDSRSTPTEPASRTWVAWLSLVVLGLLAYICVATIISVVRPVRRLMVATSRLARGEPVAPLLPGGIRELDALSAAFNTMADQLTSARQAMLDAQRRLEGRVEERTRELKHLAEKDPLTGLSNRRQLFAALSASLDRARADRLRVGAFFLDIDNFKTLNDCMGHAFGDRVLVAIAQRLEATAREFGFAARLGGDEFMIVHEGAASTTDIEASGTAIVEAFHEPLQVEGRELIVSVSVGASVYPDHEQDAEALLRAADAALFSAKALGRSRLTMFTRELLVSASAKFAIEQRLRRAIEKGEFELFYQPEIDARTFEVSLVEALIRWRMPDGTYRCPGEFLAVAEESGLIVEINDWVLRNAIETAAAWHHGPWPQARVAINVSPRQFRDFRFAEKLRELLAQYRLPASCVELELTESVLQTGPTTIKALSELRAMGVAIALDDFGTGYSSIASVEQLPLTRVKLDRSLIARMDSSPRSASIARATIGLCSELGLQVTAEGVERLEQFGALLGFRGIFLQGYLLAEPANREAVGHLLRTMPAHCQELLLSSRAIPGQAVDVSPEAGRARASPG